MYGPIPQIDVFKQPDLLLYLYMKDHERNREKKIQDVREALALLVAVAHVDYAGWRFLLERYCELNLGEEGDKRFEDVLPTRFAVIINLKRSESGRFDLVELPVCGPQQLEHPTPVYLRALKKIAEVGNIAVDQPPLDIKVPVHVKYPGNLTNGSLKVLLEVQQAEKIIRKGWRKWSQKQDLESVAAGSIRSIFVLEPMNADVGIFGENVPEISKKVQKLIRENMWFSRVAIRVEGPEPAENECEFARSFGNLMESVFDRTRRRPQLSGTEIYSPSLDSAQYQVGEIHLHCRFPLRSRDYEAMASNMVLNQASDKASICLSTDDFDPVRPQCWKWIAYGLFSRRSQQHSALRSLALMSITTMTIDDMEGFAAVLESDHPEEELFGTGRGLVNEREATLKGNAPIRWEFDMQGQPVENSRVLTFPSPLLNLWTFSDDGSSMWVNVLVPGFGRCQVMRDELEFNPPGQPSRSGGLTSLRIGFCQFNNPVWDGLPILLRAAGYSLKSLTLDRALNINTVLQSCPNLEELSLCGGYVDAKFSFVDYHLQGQLLPELRFDSESIPDLCEVLSTPSDPLFQCMRRLRIRQDESIAAGAIETSLDALLGMLSANEKLDYLEVIVPRGNDRYRGRFRAHHHNPIQRTRTPVPIKCRLAFLRFGSTFTEAGSKRKRVDSRSLSPGVQIMQHVVCRIFALAAAPVLRQVYFSQQDHITIRDEMTI